MSEECGEAGYIGLISQIDRLRKCRLDAVKAWLAKDGVLDINPIQALILFNMGDTEMTVGEMTLLGCYLGSNVSYNLKKMAANGYVKQGSSPHDRRSVTVSPTAKGRALRDWLTQMHRRHAEFLQGLITAADLKRAARTLTVLERGWHSVSDAAEPLLVDADG